jgi:GNAT superfamily N-acetyltransferase
MSLTAAHPAAGRSGAAQLRLRPIESADVDQVAAILFEAFAGIHDRHRFPRVPHARERVRPGGAVRGPPADLGRRRRTRRPHPRLELLDERAEVRGLGPITVAPAGQGLGVGRRLMFAAMDRAEAEGAPGIRLLQDSFNTRSLALYASLGFEVEEPVAVMGGRLRPGFAAGLRVRPLEEEDLPAAERLALEVLGFARTGELLDALASPLLDPLVATRAGRVVGYATTLTSFAVAHAVAETESAMAGLIAGGLALSEAPASFLLPTRQHELLRWALTAGLQVVKPMTYMAIGERRRARGAWIPSVLL